MRVYMVVANKYTPSRACQKLQGGSKIETGIAPFAPVYSYEKESKRRGLEGIWELPVDSHHTPFFGPPNFVVIGS